MENDFGRKITRALVFVAALIVLFRAIRLIRDSILLRNVTKKIVQIDTKDGILNGIFAAHSANKKGSK